MKQFLYNMGEFLHTLSLTDYIIMLLVFVVIVLLLVIYYLIKVNDEKELNSQELDFGLTDKNDKKSDELNLLELASKIEANNTPKVIPLSDYEEEQEKNAVISYKELLKRSGESNITYNDENEFQNYEVKVRKIDLNKPIKIKNYERESLNMSLMNQGNEYEFLEALKKLQNNLIK